MYWKDLGWSAIPGTADPTGNEIRAKIKLSKTDSKSSKNKTNFCFQQNMYNIQKSLGSN